MRSSSLSDWQNISQTDYSSWVMDLNQPHVTDTTDHIDGWRLAPNSQVIGKAVQMPSDINPVAVDFFGETRDSGVPTPGAHHYIDSGIDDPNVGIPGDASGNGTITAFDASLILQHASGLVDLSSNMDADSSGDGSVSAFDASLILQYLTGFISCLPADANCGANKKL